ncbi:MAG: pyroglutamyl-peptidase I [Sandaracinaceae bacterium]|nr:pyroglutamyl-peptidase I [Sandaracinaceae bacterium]
MRRVLVTGFEPFGGEPINPSWLAVQALDGETIADATVSARCLPCVFEHAFATLEREIDALEPELVVCVGQAGGRDAITLERVAINVDDASIPDNAGAQPIDAPIAEEGPVGYWSSLPIKAIVAAIREAGLPAKVSQTAGTFVCNHVFYALMRALSRRDGVRGGFVHVPYVPEQAARHEGAPSLPLEDQVRALRIALEVSLGVQRDAHLAGGATH